MIWAAVLIGAAGCYAAKVAGLSLPQRVLDDPRTRRAAALLPVALLAALTLTQTFTAGERLVLDARVVGLAVAVVAVVLRAPFLLVVVLAAASTAAVRALT